MENCKIVTRLLDGEFLNYESVVPANWETRIRVNKNLLQGCLERVSLISSSSIEKEKKYPVKINIEIGKITKYFLDALKAIDDEEVFIEFGSNISPCIIRPIEVIENEYVYMILPVRLK